MLEPAPVVVAPHQPLRSYHQRSPTRRRLLWPMWDDGDRLAAVDPDEGPTPACRTRRTSEARSRWSTSSPSWNCSRAIGLFAELHRQRVAFLRRPPATPPLPGQLALLRRLHYPGAAGSELLAAADRPSRDQPGGRPDGGLRAGPAGRHPGHQPPGTELKPRSSAWRSARAHLHQPPGRQGVRARCWRARRRRPASRRAWRLGRRLSPSPRAPGGQPLACDKKLRPCSTSPRLPPRLPLGGQVTEASSPAPTPWHPGPAWIRVIAAGR